MLRSKIVLWGLLALSLTGCASTKTSNTARTATEQLLICNAVDQALDKIDFRAFQGHTVFLDDQYVDCLDKQYVIASVRHRILHQGAVLVTKPEEAEVLVEMRTGVVGTDLAESFLGIPEVTVPGMLTLPEVRVLTRQVQTGTAKLGIVAVDAKTKEVLGEGGMTLARSDDSAWFAAGIGPFKTGTINGEVKRMTSGPAAIMRDRLPATVAFLPPHSQQALEEPPVQYTNTTQTAFEEEPAAAEAP